jgi:hypothetical protein
MLDQDIMKIPAEKILATKVLAAYIYGQALYKAGF